MRTLQVGSICSLDVAVVESVLADRMMMMMMCAGVRMNLLSLQPALRTLTSDYNCLKKQVQDFPSMLDKAISEAKQEVRGADASQNRLLAARSEEEEHQWAGSDGVSAPPVSRSAR